MTMAGLLRPITADEIQAFDRDGAVLLKGVIGQEWVDMLAEGLEYANNHRTVCLPVSLNPFELISSPRAILPDSRNSWMNHPLLKSWAQYCRTR